MNTFAQSFEKTILIYHLVPMRWEIREKFQRYNKFIDIELIQNHSKATQTFINYMNHLNQGEVMKIRKNASYCLFRLFIFATP